MASERASEPTCTCPSGGGSLRWPCPVHPSRSTADVMCEMAVAELTAAASAGTPEHGDRAVSPGMYFGPQRATRLRAAIAHVQAMQAARTDALVFDYKAVAENAVLAFTRVAAALGCTGGGGADAVLAAIAKLRAPAAPAGHVAIVCDFRRSTPFPEFIEAEIDGRSVSLQWRDRADGTHELLVPVTAAPATDEQYADADALIAALDKLMDDGGQGGEKWEPAQAAIAGIRAWQAGTPAVPRIGLVSDILTDLSNVAGSWVVEAAGASADAQNECAMQMHEAIERWSNMLRLGDASPKNDTQLGYTLADIHDAFSRGKAAASPKGGRLDARLLVRDCCEAERADPDQQDTICISVDQLTEIAQRHAGRDSPKGGSEAVPSAWISDNDMLKLRDSIDEARNIRMSSERTHLRVHPVFIPAMQVPVRLAGDAEVQP